MTRAQKWKILREMPVMDDESWFTLVAILDTMVIRGVK